MPQPANKPLQPTSGGHPFGEGGTLLAPLAAERQRSVQKTNDQTIRKSDANTIPRQLWNYTNWCNAVRERLAGLFIRGDEAIPLVGAIRSLCAEIERSELRNSMGVFPAVIYLRDLADLIDQDVRRKCSDEAS